MGSCLGSLVGSCCASLACKACSCQCDAGTLFAHYIYVFLITIAAGAALGLRYSGVDLNVGNSVGGWGTPSVCPGPLPCDGLSYSICNSPACTGYWSVYRISFSIAVFFALMLLFTACKSTFSAKLHRGYWGPKVFLILAIGASAIFMPNDVFAVYAWISRFVAPLFILFSLTMFIDFGYKTSNYFVEKDEREDVFFGCANGGNTYKVVLLLASICLVVGSCVASGYLYANDYASCGFGMAAITTNLVFSIINVIIGLSKVAPHASPFVSALVFGYATFTTFDAISSWPEEDCNPSLRNSGLGITIVSCCIAAIAIGYIASNINRWTQTNTEIATGGLGKTGADEVTVEVVDDSSADGKEVEPHSFGFYHLLMLAVSMYLAMLLTDWGVEHGSPADSAGASTRHNVGETSAWIKLVFAWVCNGLYFWTLVAPRCCPNRDFGVEVEPLCEDGPCS